MTTPLVKRTTLIVRDLARSVAFYRDVIGLSVWYDDTIELSGVGLAAGKKGDQTQDRKSTRLNSSHVSESRMPSSA